MQSVTFRDFEFAINRKQFRKLNGSNPEFCNILFYAKTTDDPYEYYVLYNPKKIKQKDGYIYKDTVMGNSRFVLAISKKAPETDKKFIMDRLSIIQ